MLVIVSHSFHRRIFSLIWPIWNFLKKVDLALFIYLSLIQLPSDSVCDLENPQTFFFPSERIRKMCEIMTLIKVYLTKPVHVSLIACSFDLEEVDSFKR